MTTLTGEQESRVIESEEELYTFFHQFAKPTSERRVGIECEFFGVERETGRGIPYLGPRGVEAIISRLAATFHYEPILEEGHVIALKRKDIWVTLEPGGQLELSAPPVRTIFEIEKQLENFKHELAQIESYFPGIAWLSVGLQPFSPLDQLPWVPKRRYALMKSYLKSRGALAHEMMKRTATNQVNLDFQDEATALSQFRTVLGTTSIVSAMFAHSGFSDGEPNGYLSRRAHIWQHTDPDRCGLLVDFIKEGKSFRDYVEYLLEMPMIFIIRNDQWIPMEGITFREFIRKGKNSYRATLSDFELQVSTAFPEARLKHYLEIRGADAQRFPLIPTVAAFWKGILYESEIREKVWNLVRDFNPKERLKLYEAVPREGLKAKLGKVPVLELARQLYLFSCEGLGRQASKGERSECVFLERMNEEILKPARTPAEVVLDKWMGEWGQNKEHLIRYLELNPQ